MLKKASAEKELMLKMKKAYAKKHLLKRASAEKDAINEKTNKP